MLFHRLVGFLTRSLFSPPIAALNERRSRRRADTNVTVIVESLEVRKMFSAAPVVGGFQDAFYYTENAPATPITPNLTITDADTTMINLATVQITSNHYARGEDVLSFTNTPNISGSWNAATGTLTLSGTDTVANYQAALRSVSYQNLSANPSNNVGRVFAFQVSDGMNASAFGFQGMYFNSMSSHLKNSDATYVEGTPGTPITNSLNLAPTATGTLASVSVLDVYYTGDSGDPLSSNGAPTVPGNWYAGSGTLTLSGTNSAANFQASLRSVTYKNLNLDPGSSPRFFQFVANYTTTPGSGSPADLPQYILAAHQGLNAIPVNIPPVISNVESARASYTANSSPAKVTSTLSITDPGNTSLTNATVRIDANYVNGQDVLAFADTAHITGNWNATTGTLTLTGTDTVANYEAALRSVTYQNLSSNPNTLVRRFAFVTNDGATSSSPAFRYFNISSMISNLETTNYDYHAGDSATAITNTLTLAPTATGTLSSASIQINANYVNGQDLLMFTNTSTITGSWNAATGTLTLSGTDTVANYEAALRSVMYQNASNTPDTQVRGFRILVNNGTNPSLIANRDFNIIL